MSEEHKATFREYMQMWVEGDTSRLGDVIGPGYVGHSGADPAKDDDLESLRARIVEYHERMPDAEVSVEHQVAEGNLVATRMTARRGGGPGPGLAGFNVSRFEGGKIVEEWALWERPG